MDTLTSETVIHEKDDVITDIKLDSDQEGETRSEDKEIEESLEPEKIGDEDVILLEDEIIGWTVRWL